MDRQTAIEHAATIWVNHQDLTNKSAVEVFKMYTDAIQSISELPENVGGFKSWTKDN